MSYLEWLNTFFEEKQIEKEDWYFEIGDNPVITGTDDAIELLRNITDKRTQGIVKNKLVQIDFVNGNVNDFLHYVLKGHLEVTIGGAGDE